jgi:hypothetical protein
LAAPRRLGGAGAGAAEVSASAAASVEHGEEAVRDGQFALQVARRVRGVERLGQHRFHLCIVRIR